jgi:geranylgeranyl reductase family protein
MKKFDVVVVGGGPIGGYIAEKISKKNFKVGIFEKKREIGLPLQCAGIVTPRIFDFLQIPKYRIIQNEIKGANIHSPHGKILTIGGNKTHVYAIDRILFDKEILELAKEHGSKIFLGSTVSAFHKINNHMEIRTLEGLTAQGKLVIGADGPFSKTRRAFGFQEPNEFLRSIGAEVYGSNLNASYLEIFLGNNIAPGFFAWIIPICRDGSSARIGLCISEDAKYSPKYYFLKFLKHNLTKQYLDNIKIKKYTSGVIPLGILKNTFDSNVMIVGDAACQVKPTSGGGLFYGLKCGQYCSNVAMDALNNNNFSNRYLKKYDVLWRKDLIRELNIGWKFRTFFKKINDKQLDKYISRLKNPKIINIINNYGDIDYPSRLIKPFVKNFPFFFSIILDLFNNVKNQN